MQERHHVNNILCLSINEHFSTCWCSVPNAEKSTPEVGTSTTALNGMIANEGIRKEVTKCCTNLQNIKHTREDLEKGSFGLEWFSMHCGVQYFSGKAGEFNEGSEKAPGLYLPIADNDLYSNCKERSSTCSGLAPNCTLQLPATSVHGWKMLSGFWGKQKLQNKESRKTIWLMNVKKEKSGLYWHCFALLKYGHAHHPFGITPKRFNLKHFGISTAYTAVLHSLIHFKLYIVLFIV